MFKYQHLKTIPALLEAITREVVKKFCIEEI